MSSKLLFRFGFSHLLLALAVQAAVPTWLAPTDARIQMQGRYAVVSAQEIQFDWPATRILFRFSGTGATIRLGGLNQYEVTVDGVVGERIAAADSVAEFTLAQGLEDGPHTVVIAKRTESLGNTASFEGIRLLGPKAQLLDPPARPQRRIEFIGDSYTVGYGNESVIQTPAENQVDSLLFATTNAQRSFASLVGKRLGAEIQVNAISGRGLVRNYNGFSPGKEYAYFYPYALLTERERTGNAPRWDLNSWHPQVLVIGLGINDWQAQPPYPEAAQWDKAYAAFLDSLRVIHPGVKFILCATAVWPNDVLIPRVQAVVAAEQARGKNDVRYFEYTASKSALWSHPSVLDHEAIARALVPLVTELGGWRSR